jgi:hypothetical protein
LQSEFRAEESAKDHFEATGPQESLRVAKQANLITAVAATVSFLGLVAVFLNVQLTKISTNAQVEQAKTANKEYEASERPWVTASYQPIATEPLQFSQSDIATLVAVTVSNVGHSVAQSVQFRNFFIPTLSETGHECDDPEKGPVSNPRLRAGTIILPGETQKIALPVDIPSDRRPPTVRDNMSFDFIGCVTYGSVVDGTRHTTMRLMLLGAGENVTNHVKNPAPGKTYRSYEFLFQTYGSFAN